MKKWSHSSVGRAPALQAGGHRFKSCCDHHKFGGVAQLVRAHACHAWGREFEPRHSRHYICPDSSVGRAGDWKSPCPWFDSASGHHLIQVATSPSGKAEVCKISTTSSNLVVASIKKLNSLRTVFFYLLFKNKGLKLTIENKR